MIHAIFPGCLIQYRFPEYEKSARYILDALDIEYEFIDEFSCCGSQIVESIDDALLNLIAGRNLALAEKHKIHSVITLCGSCTYILKKTKIELDNSGVREIVNESLKKIDLKYTPEIKVQHLAELLNESPYLQKLKSKIIKKQSFNLVFQNPCMISRPQTISKIDIKKDTFIKNLLTLCGGNVLDYEYQDKCCQGTMLAFKKSVGEPLVKKRYESLEKLNADFMIISCPNCQLVYNTFPSSFGANIMPTMFFTQFIGLALGATPKELGLDRNIDFKRIYKLLTK